MRALSSFSTLMAAAVTLAPVAARATTLSPGGPPQSISSISVTVDGYLPGSSGTVSSGAVSASYNELVVQDGSNPFGVDDLTFLIAVGNGTAPIQGVTIGNVFSTPSAVSVGYIAGGGDFGLDVPLTAQEAADGTVQFNFNDMDSIAAGTGTEFLVVQTSATSLPSGDVGIISIVPAAPVPVGATPEPGTLVLMGMGLMAGAIPLLRRRGRIPL